MKSLGLLFLIIAGSLSAESIPTLYYKRGSDLLRVAITQSGYVVLNDPAIKNRYSWPRVGLGGGFIVRDNSVDGGKLSDIVINRVNQSCEIESGIRVHIGGGEGTQGGREYWGADAVAISSSGSSSTESRTLSTTSISATQAGARVEFISQDNSATKGETKVTASQEKIYRLNYTCWVKSKVPISNAIGALQCSDGNGRLHAYTIWIGPLEADKTVPIGIVLPLSKKSGEGDIKFDKFYIFSYDSNYPCVDMDTQ